MKASFTQFFVIGFVIIIASCGKDNSTNNKVNFVVTTDQSLSVFTDKAQITANGEEQVIITVKDKANNDVTATSVIYVNNNPLTTNVFATNIPGSYQVRATKGSLASPVINLIASNGLTSVFTKKVVAEFFTGTWCGICPGTLIPLENYIKTNPNIIMVGVHGPNGSSDPFQYIYDTELRNRFGVNGVPSVLLDRGGFWDSRNSTLDQLSTNSTPIGIALQTAISGHNIAVKAKVKFASSINSPLKLIVMLVEDGIPYNQTNYGHFNLPNPIVNYLHYNVLRSTGTDIFGDTIPLTQQIKDNTWQKDLTIDASKYIIARCKIVAFVVYDTNAQSLKGALNAQIADAGQSVNF